MAAGPKKDAREAHPCPACQRNRSSPIPSTATDQLVGQPSDNIWVVPAVRSSAGCGLDNDLRRRPAVRPDHIQTSLVMMAGRCCCHGQSEAGRYTFDATCRKLFRFSTVSAIVTAALPRQKTGSRH